MIFEPQKFISSLPSSTYKTLRFILYVTLIFFAHITSSIYVEKIYKTPYKTNDGSSSDNFNHILAIPLVNSFVAMFYGFLKYEIAMKGQYRSSQNPVPYTRYLKLGFVEVVIILLGNWAIVLSSFTTYNLIHCCSFLSVVLFAVFFSKLQDESLQIRKSKIYISILVCFGIFLFNFYGTQDSNSANKPLTIGSLGVILVLLIIEGYRPDLVVRIRSQFHPSPSLLYYSVATVIFITLFILSLVTLEIWKVGVFVWDHDTLAWDLMIHAILVVFGQIFIYRLLLLHRQHVVPLVSTIRKFTTSIINLIWFHHTVNLGQYFGLAIVCIGVFIELYSNYLESEGKERTSKIEDNEDLQDTI